MGLFGKRKRNAGLSQHADAYKAMERRRAPTTKVADAELVPFMEVADSLTNFYAGRQQQLSANLQNGLSGAGGPADKSGFFSFLPTYLNDKGTVERMCVESWAADRFVNMPIDDMFTEPRQYDDDRFREHAEIIKADKKLSNAMKAARKFGTGMIWAFTKEMPPEMPMDPKRIRPNDLVNIIVLSRYDCTVMTRVMDIESPRLGEPEMYQVHVHQVGTFNVHASRLYRFDGIESETINGWESYDQDWGVSNLSQAVTEIFNDKSIVQAVNHLVQEASIPVQKVQGLAEVLCAKPAEDELSIEERMAAANRLKSIYSTLLMDANDTFERINVSFTGLPDLLEKSSDRLASMAGISATRFLNKSPDGQNATGEGDMRNDNRTTAARQEHTLKPAYRWLDKLIAASAGVEVPEYTFPPLYEPTQTELAETENKRADTATKMTVSASWSEEEGKDYVATGILPTGPVEADLTEPEPKVPDAEA